MNEVVGLGKAIQTARQNAGLTQQDLCDRAKLSYSTLAKIERGAIKTPSIFTVKSIAEVLEMSLDSLLGTMTGVNKFEDIQKKKSKTGISFLYMDINGCLVRFFHAAFTRISHDTGVSSERVETTFWHYNDAICRGEMSMDEFNLKFAETIGVKKIDWNHYYLGAIEAISEMSELVNWASKHYKIGLLSNIMPGQIEAMISAGLLPNVHYDSIVDSSQVKAIKPEQKIYDIAEQNVGVPPNEILFIDDSRTNLMAADRMGWRVLWFDDFRPQDSVAKIRASLEF